MEAMAAAPRNTKGFVSQVSRGVLPPLEHITYEGAFNQSFFKIGPTDKELDLYYGVSSMVPPTSSAHLGSRNQFLTLFLKSCRDGKQRTQSIHAVIALDISGSMKEPINKKTGVTRLQLARDAIKKFYDKLKHGDIFGLVVFQDRAKTIIPSNFIEILDRKVCFDLIDSNFQLGGTSLRAGFQQSERHFKNSNIYKRIIMLTDVNDNSLRNEYHFVQKLSASSIHTSIIGISDEFNSATCQQLIKVRGFNYLCATEQEDMLNYLYKQFDYTFFPSAFNISIDFTGDNVQAIEVYGTPDGKNKAPWGQFHQGSFKFNITNLNCAFPSAIFDGMTKGGLILVQLIPRDTNNKSLSGTLSLQYDTLTGERCRQTYNVSSNGKVDEVSEKAIRIFYYVDGIRNIIRRMNSNDTLLTSINKERYVELLEQLSCQIDNKEMLKNVKELIKIVEKHE